jgi:hypothetical protein
MSPRMELSADVRLAPEVACGGTLEGWQAAAEAAATAPNTPHWTLGLASGFAGCILQLVRLDTCGLCLSGPSSCGKTLSQQIAVSVWTSPRLASGGLLRPARFTENAIEALARASNGLVLALDELALIDGKTLGQVIYGLASGSGKARMTVGLKMQKPITWSTFVVLSCEQTLDHKIRGEGGKWSAGQSVRFADVDCSEVNRKVPQETIAAIRGIFQHFGEAGPEFIRRFKAAGQHRDSDTLRSRILTRADQLARGENQGDFPGVQSRSALPFALLSVSGDLAKEFEVLPRSVDVEGAVHWAWNGYIASSGARALDPEQQAEETLRRWVAERRGITIKTISGWPRNNRDAVAWTDGETGALYLPGDRVVEACGGGLSERAIGRMLNERGLLARSRGDRLTVNYVPQIGHVRCYALKLDEFAPAAGGEGEEHREGRDE